MEVSASSSIKQLSFVSVFKCMCKGLTSSSFKLSFCSIIATLVALLLVGSQKLTPRSSPSVLPDPPTPENYTPQNPLHFNRQLVSGNGGHWQKTGKETTWLFLFPFLWTSGSISSFYLFWVLFTPSFLLDIKALEGIAAEPVYCWNLRVACSCVVFVFF